MRSNEQLNKQILLWFVGTCKDMSFKIKTRIFVHQYGKSWQATPATLDTLDISDQAQCEQPLVPDCVLPPPEANPCYNLYNADRFGAVSIFMLKVFVGK